MTRAIVIRHMQAIPQITSDNHHPYVYTQADSRAKRYVFKECFPIECASRAHGVILEQPDISGINEHRAVKHAGLSGNDTLC